MYNDPVLIFYTDDRVVLVSCENNCEPSLMSEVPAVNLLLVGNTSNYAVYIIMQSLQYSAVFTMQCLMFNCRMLCALGALQQF